MRDIVWLSVQDVILYHKVAIEDNGGSEGILDSGRLESTVNIPKQLAYYQSDADIFDLTASLGYGIAKNHCFVDGNKRTALIAMGAFLYINGLQLNASQEEAVVTVVEVVASTLSEQNLSQWLKNNC